MRYLTLPHKRPNDENNFGCMHVLATTFLHYMAHAYVAFFD